MPVASFGNAYSQSPGWRASERMLVRSYEQTMPAIIQKPAYTPAVVVTSGPSGWIYGDDPLLNFAAFSWPNHGVIITPFTEATNKPIAGLINGRRAVDFDGTNDTCGDGVVSGYITSTLWFADGVARMDTNKVAAVTKNWTGVPLWTDASGWVGVFLYYDGTRMVLYAYQFDGGGVKVTPDNPSMYVLPGEIFYWEAQFNGTTLSCRKNNGAAQTVGSGAIGSVAANMQLAFGSLSVAAFDGAEGENLWIKTIPAVNNLRYTRQWFRTRWSVTPP